MEPPKDFVELIFGVIFTIPGLVLVGCGILSLRSARRKLRLWKRASGTVVGYSEMKTSAGKPCSYMPQVEFTTDDGKTLAFTSSHGTGKKRYPDGTTVNVLYAPEDPASATIQSFSDLFLLSIILLLMGAVFLGISYFNFVSGWHP